jgi:HSP20 family protein
MTLPIRRHRPVIDGRTGALARDPLSEFDDLFDRMGSLLETTLGGGYAPAGGAWAPLADVTETEDAFVVEAELPGIRREDVDIRLAERELTIGGEYRETEREGTVHRSTRRTGRFEYRTLLPGRVTGEGVAATLSDGVLTVRVPKAPDASVRRIEITGD